MPDLIDDDILGIISTGETTIQEQIGRADRANTQNPQQIPSNLTGTVVPSNADAGTTDQTFGDDDALRTGSNIQGAQAGSPYPGSLPPGSADDGSGSVNSVDQNFIDANNPVGRAYPGWQTGASATGDDGAGLNPVAARIQELYGGNYETVSPTPNVLDRFASYTYNVSLYIMTPAQYARMINTRRKDVSGLKLLMSSAGAPASKSTGFSQTASRSEPSGDTDLGTVTVTASRGGRSQFFPLDYYLDNVQLKTMINGKGTMSAHSATELNFRIIEPNGISLIDNLSSVTQQLALQSGDNLNAYLGQVYLMVIRFYGYDQNGQLITPNNEDNEIQGDRNAVVEKFIPFIFSNIKFRIANKLTEYECQAYCPQNMIATAQQRGVIPYNFQISSTTLKDLLTNDLSSALNQYQAQWKSQGLITYPDEYKFELASPLDSNTVTVVPPGNTDFTKTEMGPGPNGDARRVLPSTNSVQKTTKTNSAFAGMSIVQFIDQQVRNSGYIYQQQKYIYDPKFPNTKKVQTGAGNLMAWYRIGTEAVPKLNQWDEKRGDYAYKITYKVTPYLVSDTLSDYFPRSPRWTAPKVYKYWFTGENSQIIDFTQELNNLYYYAVTTAQLGTSDSVMKNQIKKNPQPVSPASSQGSDGKVNEPGANAAAYLYNPADFARLRMTILGDPDWIEQGEVWEGVTGRDFDTSAFLSDGTINYESREVVFDVIFNTPSDYDFNYGTVTTPSSSTAASQRPGVARSLEMRTRYKAVWVTHNFSQGRFTQDIEGLMIVPEVADQRASGSLLNTFSAGAVNADNQTSTTTSLVTESNVNANNDTQSSVILNPNANNNYFAATPTLSDNFLFNLDSPIDQLFPGQVSAPTSGTQIIGTASVNGSTNFATGGTFVTPVSVNITLLNGTNVSVSSEAEINELFNQGQIDFRTASTGINSIRSLQSAQQTTINNGPVQFINRGDP